MASRRDFIKIGSAAAAAAFIPGLAGAVMARTNDGLSTIPAEIRRRASFYKGSNFEPFLNTDFEVSNADLKSPQSLKLVEVKESRSKPHTPLGVRTTSCSLIFEDAGQSSLPQNIYQLKNETLGNFSVLLVPISHKGKFYEVIFNRI